MRKFSSQVFGSVADSLTKCWCTGLCVRGDVGDVVLQIFIAISEIAHRILYNKDRSQICDSMLSSLWRKYYDDRKMIG